MLSRRENKVMSVLHGQCANKKSVLISPIDLIKLSGVEKITLTELEKVVKDLSTDGYFDLIYSDRHGETVYCISLTEKGRGFVRGERLIKRNLLFRLVVSVVFAILSFLIGLILKAVF